MHALGELLMKSELYIAFVSSNGEAWDSSNEFDQLTETRCASNAHDKVLLAP